MPDGWCYPCLVRRWRAANPISTAAATSAEIPPSTSHGLPLEPPPGRPVLIPAAKEVDGEVTVCGEWGDDGVGDGVVLRGRTPASMVWSTKPDNGAVTSAVPIALVPVIVAFESCRASPPAPTVV